MVRFTDLHRVYLQALLSRRFISETVALELYKRAVKAVRGESIVPGKPLAEPMKYRQKSRVTHTNLLSP